MKQSMVVVFVSLFVLPVILSCGNNDTDQIPEVVSKNCVDIDEALPHYKTVSNNVDIDEALPHYKTANSSVDIDEALPHYKWVGCENSSDNFKQNASRVDIDEALPHYKTANSSVDIDEALPHYKHFGEALDIVGMPLPDALAGLGNPKTVDLEPEAGVSCLVALFENSLPIKICYQ